MTSLHLGASRIAGADACAKILLVGESNPYGGRPDYALYNEPMNSAGGRLQRLIFGVSGRRWYLPMWRVNLCSGQFDRDAGEQKANELLGDAPWTTIVILGRNVQHAFGWFSRDAFGDVTPATKAGRLIVALPHPSGRNTCWTDPANIQLARSRMRTVAPEIPWGELDQDQEDRTP